MSCVRLKAFAVAALMLVAACSKEPSDSQSSKVATRNETGSQIASAVTPIAPSNSALHLVSLSGDSSIPKGLTGLTMCPPGSLCFRSNNRILRTPTTEARWNPSDPVLGRYIKAVDGILELFKGAGAGEACVATHVGGGKMVSAAHCMPGLKEGSACSAYTLRSQKKKEFSCKKVLSYRLETRVDYVVFNVKGDASSLPIAIEVGTALDLQSEQFMLFGYFYDDDDAYVFASGKCNKEFKTDFLLHDCCTSNGVSGSPILAISKSNTPVLIAVHSGPGTEMNWATAITKINFSQE